MKNEIITDKEKATFQAKREFNANVSLVWRAFTEPELLDQWWAPKPWKCETKSMNFKPNGKWKYEMVGPMEIGMVQFRSLKKSFLKNSFQVLVPLQMTMVK